MANSNYDLSDLGGTPVQNYDLSDLGGVPITTQSLPDNQSLSHQVANSTGSSLGGHLLDKLVNTTAGNALGQIPASQAANSTFGRGLLGAGNALGQIPTGLINLIPGLHATNPIPNENNLPFDIGQVAGNIGGFVAGGDAADIARGASEGLPYVGKIAQALGGNGLSGLARRAVGSAGFGALTNENDPLKGAAEGAGFSALGDLPFAAAPAINYFRPEQYAKNIIGKISSGNSLEDNAKSLAQDIQNSFGQQYKAGSSQYDSVLNNPSISVLGNNVLDYGNPNAQNILAGISKKLLPNTKDLYQQFLDQPSVQNAHLFQSQLGSDIRSLDGTKDVATQGRIQLYQKAQKAVNSSLNNYLDNVSSYLGNGADLKGQYQAASDNWLKNVVPYTEGNQLSKIASGENTNPTGAQIKSIFESPEPSTLKIASDLGPDSINKILYSQLGKTSATSSASNFSKAISNLNQQGLGSYMNPDIQNQFKSLTNRIGAREGLQNLSGAILGAHLSSSLPAAALGAVVGGKYTAPLMRWGRSLVPDPLASAISSGLNNAYPLARTAVLPNLISGAQQ